MVIFVGRSWFFTLLILAVASGSRSFATADDARSKSLQELETILREWEGAKNDYYKVLMSAKTRAEREKVTAAKAPNPAPFAERCLKLAEKYPSTKTELTALWWAVCNAPEADAGKKAYDRLAKGRMASADLGDLAAAFTKIHVDSDPRKVLGLAPIVLARVKQDPGHSQAAWLLNWICSASLPGLIDQKDPPPLFSEAADLIVARYAGSPEITNFCECLGMGDGSPPWAGKYEQNLRTISKENRNRRVRGGAAFALASVVHFTGGEARQDEADKLYQQYLSEFDGSDRQNGPVEKQQRRIAQAAREELRWRAVGKPVPEIEGKDLEGRPLKLLDHRGKVVLISFWGTWCFPCMKLVPHECGLVERLRDKPFVLLGVNCDTDEEALKEALVKQKITWRSFRNKQGTDQTISSEWDVIGFPTLYLVDHKGFIRKRWVGAPPPEELNRAIDEQIDKVNGKAK
ncbi:MAG TPA: TlpA disulfide reductase family protein [Gemmataceae bacterium]|jgi:thiol-disulfide isomerase/thioredoxin|nr:TlpA disulfide reductase family protein [Gemmataceae bacterium]